MTKGFTQKYDIDYEETFAPVARLTSVRSLIANNLNSYFDDILIVFNRFLMDVQCLFDALQSERLKSKSMLFDNFSMQV